VTSNKRGWAKEGLNIRQSQAFTNCSRLRKAANKCTTHAGRVLPSVCGCFLFSCLRRALLSHFTSVSCGFSLPSPQLFLPSHVADCTALPNTTTAMSCVNDITGTVLSDAVSQASSLLLSFPSPPTYATAVPTLPSAKPSTTLSAALSALQSGHLLLRCFTCSEVAAAIGSCEEAERNGHLLPSPLPSPLVSPKGSKHASASFKGPGIAVHWSDDVFSVDTASGSSPTRLFSSGSRVPTWVSALPRAKSTSSSSASWRTAWGVCVGGFLVLSDRCPVNRKEEEELRRGEGRAAWPVGVTGLVQKATVHAAPAVPGTSPDSRPLKRKSMSPSALRGMSTQTSNPLSTALNSPFVPSHPLNDVRLPTFPIILAVIDIAKADWVSIHQLPAEERGGEGSEPFVWQLYVSGAAVLPRHDASAYLGHTTSPGCIALTFAASSQRDIADWVNAFALQRVYGRMCPQAMHWALPAWLPEWMAADGYVSGLLPGAVEGAGVPSADMFGGQQHIPLSGHTATGPVGHPLLTYWEELGKPPRCKPHSDGRDSVPIMSATSRGALASPLKKYVAFPHWATDAAATTANPMSPGINNRGGAGARPQLRPHPPPIAKTFTRSKRVEAGPAVITSNPLSPVGHSPSLPESETPSTGADVILSSPLVSPAATLVIVTGPASAPVSLHNVIHTTSRTMLGEGAFGSVFRGCHAGGVPPHAYRPFLAAYQRLVGGSITTRQHHTRKWDINLHGTPVAIKISSLPQRFSTSIGKAAAAPPLHASVIRDSLRRWKVVASEILALERISWYYQAQDAQRNGALTSRVSTVFDTRGRHAGTSSRLLLKNLVGATPTVVRTDSDIFPVLPFLIDAVETLITHEHGTSLLPTGVQLAPGAVQTEVAIIMNLVEGHDLWKVASCLRRAAPEETLSEPSVPGSPTMSRQLPSEVMFAPCPYPLTFSIPGEEELSLPTLISRLQPSNTTGIAAPALPESIAKGVIHDVALALARLHALGIAHRDVKPENVQLVVSRLQQTDDSGVTTTRMTLRAVLIDLGFAFVNVVEDMSRSRMPLDAAMLRTLFGTRYAAAPEIWMAADAASEKRRSDATTDVAILDSNSAYSFFVDSWGLGVVMYCALFGCLPFDDSGGVGELKANIMAGKWQLSARAASQVSSEAVDLMNGLFRVAPEDRLTPRQVLAHRWFRG
jgi:serine/threonine protein kinase